MLRGEELGFGRVRKEAVEGGQEADTWRAGWGPLGSIGQKTEVSIFTCQNNFYSLNVNVFNSVERVSLPDVS